MFGSICIQLSGLGAMWRNSLERSSNGVGQSANRHDDKHQANHSRPDIESTESPFKENFASTCPKPEPKSSTRDRWIRGGFRENPLTTSAVIKSEGTGTDNRFSTIDAYDTTTTSKRRLDSNSK